MDDRKVFVGNVPPSSLTQKNLVTFFKKFGPIEDAFIIRDALTNAGRRCAIVTFVTQETAGDDFVAKQS
jgi:RNA recognition motif-containing protein